MQFKRVERALAARRSRPGDEHLDRLKARVAEEYAAFRKSVEEWGKVRDQWVVDRKQRLLQRWEETNFRLQLKQIEQGLRLQRRRLRRAASARSTRLNCIATSDRWIQRSGTRFRLSARPT